MSEREASATKPPPPLLATLAGFVSAESTRFSRYVLAPWPAGPAFLDTYTYVLLFRGRAGVIGAATAIPGTLLSSRARPTFLWAPPPRPPPMTLWCL